MIPVLFVTSELYPLVKTGGLADVSSSLPEALCGLGYDVQVLLPGYPDALAAARKAGSRRKAQFRIGQYEVSLWQTRVPGTAFTLWLVDCPLLFDRPGNPYQNEEGQDWWDNAHRFELFGRVGAMMAMGEAGLSWTPDLVHCNDWQTGLIPVFMAPVSRRPGIIFTIHNLAYHGVFPHQTFQDLGLPESLWRWDQLEFHGQLSFIKGGLVFSDRITTVSPGYAREIQTPEFGHGLDGLLRSRQEALTGILNGIDVRVWNPQEDPELTFHYRRNHLKNKARCKVSLQQELCLDVSDGPLLSFIGRLVEQKGVDWLISVMPELLERHCQFVLLGSGEARYEAPLKQLAQQWPGQMSLTLGYDEGLAHRITAGSDIFLMPSRFEPCGLNQMYSLRYGTVPVVHAVGGLSDTVHDPQDADTSVANGFRFSEANEQSLLAAINRALESYSNRQSWRRLQDNGMAADYSWQQRAQSYDDLYQAILKEREQHQLD
ncbi:glycogen synthase GlgA [Marinobacter changyiensis]|uniref:glycogen synthase GlgA n=1 Tax=Marinobacter changyiensis TaxID=2604091 RepID=UPI001264578A|nr:glycogen synthase GlgA [Marinobacter changyiensis]